MVPPSKLFIIITIIITNVTINYAANKAGGMFIVPNPLLVARGSIISPPFNTSLISIIISCFVLQTVQIFVRFNFISPPFSNTSWQSVKKRYGGLPCLDSNLQASRGTSSLALCFRQFGFSQT